MISTKDCRAEEVVGSVKGQQSVKGEKEASDVRRITEQRERRGESEGEVN